MPAIADPPFTLSGMRVVRLDPSGRLIEFHAVPPQLESDSSPPAAPDWNALFDAAGLSMSAFHTIEPRWLPRNEADARSAWEGPFPDIPGGTARVEAASYRGVPIYFQLIAPWTQPARMATPQPWTMGDAIGTVATAIGVLILVASALLARRHWRTGRGDPRGAFRTATIVFVTQTAAYLLKARHFTRLDVEYVRMIEILGATTFAAIGLWLLYMAFEPYVRRFWPQLLIGWSRLLSGRVLDPLVGRDVLVGAAAGTIAALITASREIIPYLLHRSLQTPQLPLAMMLLGTRYALGGALGLVLASLNNALQLVCIVVFLKILVRRTWLVLVLSVVVTVPIAMNGAFSGQQLAIELAIVLTGIVLVFGVLLQFGLLALVVTFYTFLVMGVFPLTTDLARPYAGTSIVLVLAIAAVSAFGFYASRGGEPLFGRALLD